MSPVKCFPSDFGVSPQNSSGLNSGINAFSFENATNSTATCSTQPKPRKFFKSRAAEDPTKNTSSYQNSSLHSSCVDFPLNHGEVHSGANIYPATSSGVGYLSPPAYTSPTSKLTTKRGRGRPKGTRTTCPRGPTTATYKPSPGRGATTRGRRRAKGNRTIRGHQSVGRGKRKRSQWENESESEEEEETASSELEEPAASLGEIGLYEEEEQETEEQENKNGAESFDELESKEEPKPPIKLRIIRRNDTDAFVSKVDSESNNVTDEMLSDTPATVFSNQLSPKMLEHFDKDADIQPILSEQDTSISQQLPIKRESPVEQYTTIEVSLLLS